MSSSSCSLAVRRGFGSTLALLLLASTAVRGAEIDAERLTGRPGPNARIEQLDEDLRAAFEAALEKYDEELAAFPYDPVGYADKCRFIAAFIDSREYFDWFDEAIAREEECRASLRARFPGHPEVELLDLEQLYDYQAVVETGEALLAQARYPLWTNGQIARLDTLLAIAKSDTGDAETAAQYALRALALDERSDVRLIAATGLHERGDTDQAIEVLTAPFDGHIEGDGWYLLNKMQLLAELGARDAMLEVHGTMQEHAQYYDHVAVARLLREHGLYGLARDELELASEVNTYTTDDERERFRLEYEVGSPAAALAAYDALRDFGWSEDPIGINRFALVLRDPTLPWRPRELLGLAGAAAVFAGLALFAALPVSLVHYRGLARRARSGESYPVDGFTLRHAWLALFASGLASVVALYSAGPMSVALDPLHGWAGDASAAQSARFAVVETFLTLLFLLPLGWLMVKLDRNHWTSQWSLTKSLILGVVFGYTFRLPLLIGWLASPDGVSALVSEDLLWQLLAAVREHYGVITALWMIALVAPVVEELIFRGVLLRAFSSHVSFWWANALQAALFAVLHLNLPGTPMLFAIGFVCGVLARRSGGLLAPIALHATFNLIAGLVVLLGD